MRTLDPDFQEEKNKLQSSAVINLFDIEVNDTLTVYWCEWTETVTFDGKTYLAVPLKRSDIEYDASGKVSQLTISVANANRTMGEYLELYEGMIGRKVTITTVFANLLSDADAKIIDEYYVKTSYADANLVRLMLSSKLTLLDMNMPRRRFTRNFCQWEYKRAGCWITTGATFSATGDFINTGASCDHTLDGPSGCEWHVNEERFGGFFGIPANLGAVRI